MPTKDRIAARLAEYLDFSEAVDALYQEFPDVDPTTRWAIADAIERSFTGVLNRELKQLDAEAQRDESTIYTLGRLRHLAKTRAGVELSDEAQGAPL